MKDRIEGVRKHGTIRNRLLALNHNATVFNESIYEEESP